MTRGGLPCTVWPAPLAELAGVYLDETGTDPAQGGRLLMRRLVFR